MNILFITADQWQGNCISALGHSHVKTPNLDALIADGVAFKRHYAQAVPCGPSRACLYTGMYMQNHRSLLNGTPLDTRHTNLALEARKAGYKPTLFGYTDVSIDPRPAIAAGMVPGNYEGILPGMNAGAVLNGDWDEWLTWLQTKGYCVPEIPTDIFKPQSPYLDAENRGKTYSPAMYSAEDSNTAFLVNETIDFLAQQGEDPWFIHLSFYSPHPPFVVSEPYNKMYRAEDMPLPIRRETIEEEVSQHPWLEHYVFNQRGSPYTYGEQSRENHKLPDSELQQIKATYYGMMSEVDAQFGRLIRHLKRIDAYDDTLIIFTSDHGEQMGNHWSFGKYCYFDNTFHVPLIIRDPRAEARRNCNHIVDAFTESIDIMPTILEAIGVDIPLQCDGRSLLPFCAGESPENWRTEYHAEFDLRSPYNESERPPLGLKMENCMANIISSERYKYVHFAGLPPLFFDHEDDPNEFVDKSSDPAYAGRMLDYASKMLSWRMKHDDPALTNLQLLKGGLVDNMRSK